MLPQVNFSINDVEWNPQESSRNIIATAASNGNIIIWDITRDGKNPCLQYQYYYYYYYYY